MAAIEEQGRTLDEAVSKALERLGLPRCAVHVEVLEEKRKFFGLLGTPHVKIRLTYDAKAARLRAATAILQNILARMGIAARVDGVERHGSICLNVATADSGLLIGRRGQTIEALQYLVNRLVNKEADDPVQVALDIAHYQERREHHLKRLAQRLAARVKTTGQTAVMAPLNARDRRIIHRALQEDGEVRTTSKGEGVLRQVLISPRRLEQSQRREA